MVNLRIGNTLDGLFHEALLPLIVSLQFLGALDNYNTLGLGGRSFNGASKHSDLGLRNMFDGSGSIVL